MLNPQGNIFYMVQSGKVLVKEIGANFTDVTLGPGQYFGERALETGDVRGATIVAETACTLLALAREDFEQILGPLKSIINSNHNRYHHTHTHMIHVHPLIHMHCAMHVRGKKGPRH